MFKPVKCKHFDGKVRFIDKNTKSVFVGDPITLDDIDNYEWVTCGTVVYLFPKKLKDK